MLKSQQIEEPAQTPVSSREFVEAITSIETRRQDAHSQDSLPIGEAIRQLGLDLTPEEVLAEIQSQRQKEIYSVPPIVQPKRDRRLSTLRAFLVASLVLNLVFFLYVGRSSARRVAWQRSTGARRSPGIVAGGASSTQPSRPPAGRRPSSPISAPFAPSGRTSAAPSGREPLRFRTTPGSCCHASWRRISSAPDLFA